MLATASAAAGGGLLRPHQPEPPPPAIRAHTGRFAQPEGETPGGGEWIRLDAPDIADVLADAAEPIPLPPGTDVVAMLRRSPPAIPRR